MNLSHKAFAALERLMRDTRVKDADLHIAAASRQVELTIPRQTNEVEISMPVRTTEIDFQVRTATQEALAELHNPTVQDAKVESLEPSVIDEKVETINEVEVRGQPLDIHVGVHDFFKKFNISAKLYYTTSVKAVNLDRLIPRIFRYKFDTALEGRVRENLPFFKKLPVEQKPAVLSFMSEKEQLSYWRQAVIQTRKEPRHLQLLGVYPGVPYNAIEKIRVNFSHKSMCYNYKPGAQSRKGNPMNVALFTDLDTEKTVLVAMER